MTPVACILVRSDAGELFQMQSGWKTAGAVP